MAARESQVPLNSTTRPRLGFVSADFRHHAVGLLVIPALEGLSRLGFEIFCYSNSPRSDGVTARFRNIANWRPAWGLSDQLLDAQIRADGIDILFDLSGFSRGHRLGIFGRKPAPIQIAWVGYPATTGLSTMDYLLSDYWQTPVGVDEFYSEKLLRLRHPYVCFEPPQNVPDPLDSPALSNGYITFGSFNALKKINPQVMGVWSRILAELPDARLLLKSPAFDCAGTKAQAIARFQKAGIASERLTILGGSTPREHMTAMGQADIALDTFPYSGGMTTLEALWMGLPVITWPQETIAGRHSLAYLSAAGLSECVAPDADAYVALATALARDVGQLSQLRGGMRSQIRSSLLADKEGFSAELAKMLEDIFRSGWRDPN
jgi:predicted O-linked N-acetylglucosamine transferase (SPINDLY family)